MRPVVEQWRMAALVGANVALALALAHSMPPPTT
jgi:hypothetical protein